MIARQTDQLITQQSALIAITGRARPGYQLFSCSTPGRRLPALYYDTDTQSSGQ